MIASPKWTVIVLSFWIIECAQSSPPIAIAPPPETVAPSSNPTLDNTHCATSTPTIPHGYAEIRTWTPDTLQAYADSYAECATISSELCDASRKMTLAWALWRIGTPEHRRKAYKLTESLQQTPALSAEAHLLLDILTAHQRDEQHIERLQNLLRGQQRQTRELSRTLEKLKAIEHSLVEKTVPIPQVLPTQ